MLKGEDPPTCIQCDTRVSVEHILLHCIDFADARDLFYSCDSIEDLFAKHDPKVIIAFLKHIGLYDKI